jgi:hypothetical protein
MKTQRCKDAKKILEAIYVDTIFDDSRPKLTKSLSFRPARSLGTHNTRKPLAALISLHFCAFAFETCKNSLIFSWELAESLFRVPPSWRWGRDKLKWLSQDNHHYKWLMACWQIAETFLIADRRQDRLASLGKYPFLWDSCMYRMSLNNYYNLLIGKLGASVGSLSMDR